MANADYFYIVEGAMLIFLKSEVEKSCQWPRVWAHDVGS